MLFGGHFDPLTFTWPLPTPTSPYPSSLLTPQQLLAIQEELNNKKSELEQAKEEQSHTQALLKVLQEQVSEPTPPLLSQSVQTLQTRALTRADRAQGNLQETDPVLPPGIHNAIPNHSVLNPPSPLMIQAHPSYVIVSSRRQMGFDTMLNYWQRSHVSKEAACFSPV